MKKRRENAGTLSIFEKRFLFMQRKANSFKHPRCENQSKEHSLKRLSASIYTRTKKQIVVLLNKVTQQERG